MPGGLYSDAFRSASAGLAMVGPDATILEVNPAVEAISGFAREALVGRPFWAFLDPDDRSLEVWPALVSGRLPSYTAERRFLGRNGRELVLALTITPIRGDGGDAGPPGAGFVVHLEDRTGSYAADAARRAAEDQFSSAFRFAPIGMALVALDGQWLRVNPALCRLIGREERQLLKLRFQDITHPDDLEGDLLLADRLQRGEIASYELEKRYVRPDGRPVWVQLNVSLAGDAAHPEGRYYIAQIQDISERRQQAEALRRAGTTDPLTGVANRVAFLDGLDHALARPARDGGLVLLFVDLDDFKRVNDDLGHAAGDQVLVAVGARLRSAVRATDLVARFGGDEFVVLVEVHGDRGADAVAARVGAVLNRPLRLEGGLVVDLQASIGAEPVAAGASAEELVSMADAAMYAAKRARRIAV
jgi:diguanylate cyclase (GGDEF)-like protein/PAS domain S-box-containing protein